MTDGFGEVSSERKDQGAGHRVLITKNLSKKTAEVRKKTHQKKPPK